MLSEELEAITHRAVPLHDDSLAAASGPSPEARDARSLLHDDA